jgi:glycosyltransferase involved in cell wall biosynthesis
MTKRICHIINALNQGGAEGVLYRLVKSDSVNNHFVVSLTDLGFYGKKLEREGIIVKSLNIRALTFFFDFARLVCFLKKNKPNVVQTWLYHSDLIGGLAAYFAGVKNVFWGIRNSIDYPEFFSKPSYLSAYLCSYLSYFIPTKIISCSQAGVNSHSSFGYRQDLMIVIPNGFDHESFCRSSCSRNELRPKYCEDQNTFLMGVAARWDRVKNHSLLFQVIYELLAYGDQTDNFKLMIFGQDVDSSNFELNELISKYNIQKHVVIVRRNMSVPDFMSMIDVHLLASVSEGFPNVIAEAMLCQTPCISMNVGDVANIIGDFGWVTNENTAYSFHSAILSAWELHKAAKLERVGADARARIIEQFPLKKMTDNFLSAWT